MALARVAWQPVPFPSPQTWTTCIKLGGGRGEGICLGFAACPHLGIVGGHQIFSSVPKDRSGALTRSGWACPASPPEQLPEDKAGARMERAGL